MSVYEYDAVIIGGGASGLTASLYLSSRGYKTALISKGDPVCCLSTGGIDVLNGSDSPFDLLAHLPEDHPYSLVGREALIEALSFFMEIMGHAGLPYVGEPGKNRQIITPIGTTKSTGLVPCTMADADLAEDGHLHVVSFKGIKDFYPSYITSRIKNSAFSVFDAKVATTLGIAARFEDDAFLDAFISWLHDLEIPHDRVALPAVLGIRDPVSVMEKISSATGRQVFEIPTLPPSIPGLRLFRALKRLLQAKGGHLYWGREVSSFESQAGRIEAVTLSTTGRPSRVEGKVFILSTGSFVSGGLFASRNWIRETVFGLPVFVPGERKDWFNTDFFAAGHAIEKAGIEVDGTFRPKLTKMDNLFASGSILAHSEILKYQCGHGLAISTGMAAAKMCEGMLS